MDKFIVLGIEVGISLISLSYYFEDKKKIQMFFSLLMSVLALMNGKIGMVLVISSISSTCIVHFLGLMFSSAKYSKYFITIRSYGALIIMSLALIGIMTYAIYHNIFVSGSFTADVIRTFIKNLYGTSRISALPIFDISPMHFMYTTMLLYYCVFRRWINKDHLCVCVACTSVLYIITIGRMFATKWGSENFEQFGEYLTGYNQFIVSIISMNYSFLLFCLLTLFTENNNRKHSR